jgi:FkbM family methyltransferase
LIRFYLPKSYLDLIQTYISYNECFFEQELLERVSFLYSFKNKKVFDIGANIGNHTLYFSKFCQAASVISFEPQQEAFAILEKNIALNECKNVVAYNWAMGSNETMASISFDLASSKGGSRVEVDTESGDIAMKTIDGLNLEVDFIKIDVEGFEAEVLKGAQETLKRCSPVLWIEIGSKLEAINRQLATMGYILWEQLSPHDYLYKKQGASL